MSYDVWLPMETTFWEDEFWVSKRDAKLAEYCAWLIGRGITPPEDYEYLFLKSAYKSNHVHIFEFAKASDAVLFKLTFGGVSAPCLNMLS